MAQLNDLLVTGSSRFLNDIHGNADTATGASIHTVLGTQTAATGTWTGALHNVPALFDGLTINYYLPYGGSGNATLNLTLDNGTTTGAINCYYQGNSRLTTHYGAGSSIMMTYYSAGSIKVNGTATTDNRWYAGQNYADGNDQAYQLRRYYNRFVAGSNKIFPYTIIMQNADGRWESIVTSSTTGTKSRNTHGFRLGHVLLMNANATFNENAVVSDAYIWDAYTSGLVDHRYSFNTANDSTNGTTANKPVYLVGSLNASDGLFYLDTTWWTQTLPTTANGKLYIYLGDAFDYYRMDFVTIKPVYHYVNGALREFVQDAGSVNGFTVEKSVPSNAVFTDNNTTYSMTRDGESVKLTPSSGSAQSISLSSLINGLGEGSSPAQQDDYLVAQYAGGGTTTTSYHRRAVKNIVNAANVKTALGTGSGTTKYLREDGTWQTPPSGSDVNVTQTATSTSADYEVLFSATADNTTRTETARKNSNLKFNPSTGNLQATQLNGVTIGSSPKFTDNNTTYTFANGTNGFTVTPSGGSAQTVTVTPSITNNVTGSGTSGYIAKFNGANTITNGPAIGSGTTKFLREDGSWQTPAYPTVNNGTLTLQKNGTNVATFTANQSGNTTANFALHEEDVTPLVHKTYASTSYYATTSSDYNTSSWYFMSIRPTSWYKPWTVKMKIHSFCPNYTSYESYTYSTISGRSDDFVYANWNERQNSAHYYQTLYRLKKAGYDAGYGHALGISIIYGDNYTNSNYYRTFEVDYYYCENCTVTILDTPVKWSDWTGTGTTNYNSLSAINAVSRGLQESGDADSTGYNIRKIYSSIKAGSNKVFPYTFIMENADGRWESIVTSNSTGTGKSRNPHGFRLGNIFFMGQSSTYNENAVLDNYRLWYMQSDLLDHRYSFNTANDSTNGTTANKPVYLVGTLNASDGLFYLDTKWWVQDLPTTADGKLYIYLGMAYDYYRMTFDLENPIYHYVNGMVREFTQDAGTVNGFTVEKSVPSNAVFTDNNTTYTFANGTNGFTVTPSGGSAQTVTVTPSITNNVTGSGTSGYLTKFNGANTITNGPQLGSDTTKFLRNDGTWAVPSGSGSSGNKIFTVQPTPPYSVGDLYLESENDISVCTVARASGSYDSDDWGSAVDAVNSELLDSAIKSAISSTLTVVTGAGTDGGTVMWRLNPETNVPYELLVTDTPTNITSNTAKIYRFDANGLRYSASGYEGSYISLINSSGRIPAEYLTGTLNAANFSAVQNFTATMINGGKLVRGYTNNSKGTIELQDANGTVIAEVGNYGFKFYGQGSGDDRPYYIINTNGFIGYTKVNGTWTQTIKVAFDEFRMVKGYVSEEFNIGGKIKIVPQTTSTNDGIAFVAST